VKEHEGKPLSGALTEVWKAEENGLYDSQHPAPSTQRQRWARRSADRAADRADAMLAAMADKDSSAARPAGRPRRRSPDPRRRQDAERTRRLLLDAAAGEFSRHGYANARVTRIAAAAGVGHQLITYHFGGKKGLYDALNERWLNRSAELVSGPQPMAELIESFVHEVHEDEDWARTLVRETLDGGFPISDGRVARLIELVETTRLRQKRGEISEDLDVGAITLALFAATIAPAILPAFARAFVGLDPSSDAFENLYGGQLARMVAALGRREPEPEPGTESTYPAPAGKAGSTKASSRS
jgi:TetR/AcrR family transcriptional regulator